MPVDHLQPPPPAIRWGVLLFISVAMFGNYYVYDSIAPRADMLRTQLGFSSTQHRAIREPGRDVAPRPVNWADGDPASSGVTLPDEAHQSALGRSEPTT
jgi:hypothetical protein